MGAALGANGGAGSAKHRLAAEKETPMSKTLFSVSGIEIDQYDTLEEAILDAVGMWHENAPETDAYVIRDEDGLIAATIAPVGSDQAVVVYSHGQIDRYSGITYEPAAKRTRFFYNDCSTPSHRNW